jgi:Metallo-peptidase family M12
VKGISVAMVALGLVTNLPAQGGSDFFRTPVAAPLTRIPANDRPGLSAGKVALTAAERNNLLHAAHGAALRLPSLDALTGSAAGEMQYHRIQLFAPDAKILQISPAGVVVIPMPRRLFFLATHHASSAGLAVDPATGAISGLFAKGGDHLEVSSTNGLELTLSAPGIDPDGTSTCDTAVENQPGFDLAKLQSGGFRSMTAAPAGTALSYEAVVAIDTDAEWMSGKGNDTATAMNWITDVFLAMNVFYERDVETRLLIGNVTLRPNSDPYTVASDRSAQLDEFAQYWRLNMGALDRDFAALFSGRGISSGSYSGIAWINQYCQKGFLQGNRTVGSYSFHAIGSGRTPANAAIFIGHEFGHNMGSPHTHCYSPAIDQCYASEAGCYAGPLSCPTGGKGTVMSYCHFGAGSGGAGCGSSLLEFHPTVQSLLEDRLAANSPACIAAIAEPPTAPLFKDGFEIP